MAKALMAVVVPSVSRWAACHQAGRIRRDREVEERQALAAGSATPG